MNQDGVGFGTVPSDGITELLITPSTPAPYVVVLQVSRDGRTATFTASQRGASPTGCTMVAQAVGQVAP